MNLQRILEIVSIAANMAKVVGIPGVTLGANIAGDLVAIAQKANQAHVELTGQPIDIDKLQPIAPLD